MIENKEEVIDTPTEATKAPVEAATPVAAPEVFEVKILKTMEGYKVTSVTQDGNFYVVVTNEATYKLPEAEYTSLLS